MKQQMINNSRNIIVALIVVCLLAPIAALAETDLPNIVLTGLSEYKAKGPEAAVKAWIKGSAFETSLEAQSQANTFRQVETMYGAYSGYQVIKIKEISKTSKMIYLSMDYEKGPLFASFLSYKSGDKWLLSSFTFNMKPEVILPNNFF